MLVHICIDNVLYKVNQWTSEVVRGDTHNKLDDTTVQEAATTATLGETSTKAYQILPSTVYT